jgi:TatD DNase family protein
MLIDSHCHLNFPDFAEDLDAVLARAQDNGIGAMLSINTRLSEAKGIQAIADRYPPVYCSVGVHPHDAVDYAGDTLVSQIKTLAQHPKVVGIGETGLDYYYNKSPHEAQISAFCDHIRVAQDLDLPLIIHTRDADADTIACLKKYEKPKGVFHCFSGSADLAGQALEMGFYISLSGILTFKKSEDLRQIAKTIPLDRLLVETDSPFLAPVPHRGKRNEPAFTRYTAEALADIKGISYAEIAQITTDNFFSLFSKASRPL